ncbi:hypothetical protein [uncultured Pseudomonas sp.]|uniref:hypothetical protein n=1 Tax=uncultured Pseudomonas sp. TaxID=114707 RepID=UPI0026399DEE|nr:hypothetical protein [uncultured Pseudomonas sp.]
MKRKFIYLVSLIFGALLGVWLSGSVTSPIIRVAGEISTDTVQILESIKNNTLTQSTIIKSPTGSFIEVPGTWAANILILILPCLFLWAALSSQKETQNSKSIQRTKTIATIIFAALLSIFSALLSEYVRFINYLALNQDSIFHKSTGALDIFGIIVTGETLLGGLFIFIASGILPAVATLNNQTQRSQKISAAWWVFTILLIAYGLMANVSIPKT